MPIAMTTAEPSPQRQASERSEEVFERLARPLGREIKLHCYRMLGSMHEAEDLEQESYLRAWRAFDGFEGGSFRAWLYRIATNACLDALKNRKTVQRLLPDQHGPASSQMPESGPAMEVAWLEPYPDAHLEGIADGQPNPEARYAAREAVRLAFVAAIQQLPPRQRAALLLCDVLGWAANEAATLLGGSVASINSALQRARETLARHYPNGRPQASLQPSPAQQELVGRYLSAWEGHDLDGFVALLKEDATITMPPWLQWYAGRPAIRAFFAMAWKSCRGMRLVATAANGQPAFAVYARTSAEPRLAANAIHVLTLEEDKISAVTMFLQPRMFEAFGLPLALAEDAEGEVRFTPQHG